MTIMTTIENLKEKLSYYESQYDEAYKEAEKFRKLKYEAEKELEKLEAEFDVDKLKYLCGKYWKCSKIEKDCTINLYVKANRVYFDDEYYGTTVVDCTPIEICKDTDGKLKWYSYMEHCDYQVDEDFQVSNSFNPSELEEITEEEFLNNKKV